jgi:hypothetical protein
MVIYHTLYQFSLNLDCTPSLVTEIADDTSILDSRCTSIFLSVTPPCTNTQAAYIPLNVYMSNGTPI